MLFSKRILNEEMEHSLKNDFSMLPLSLDSIKGWVVETQPQVEYRREVGARAREVDSTNKDNTTTSHLRVTSTLTKNELKSGATRTTAGILKKDTTSHTAKSMTKRSAAYTVLNQIENDL